MGGNDLGVDIDYNLDDPHAKGGAFGLWLHVFYISVCEYLYAEKYFHVAAADFLFDPQNVFFDYVADRMGYEPEALRQQIKKARKV